MDNIFLNLYFVIIQFVLKIIVYWMYTSRINRKINRIKKESLDPAGLMMWEDKYFTNKIN